MRKSIKVTVIALTAVILTGGTLYMCRPKENTEVPDSTVTESIPTDVKVDIRNIPEDIPEYREITDEDTGETVIAEVQKNDPPEIKPTTPPERPKSEDSYTNPEKPPEYKKSRRLLRKRLKRIPK